jgi:outer membrane protein assembly factor BamB/tetratricopeptide (TPR) repeat protein
MLNIRRVSFALVVAGLAALVPALCSPLASGQAKVPVPAGPGMPPGVAGEAQPKQADTKPGARFSAIKLVENDNYQKMVDEAIVATNDGDWQAACEYLQAILNSEKDYFATVESRDPNTGRTKVSAISIKLEANALIAKMPPEGLNTYELKFGTLAKQKLEDAKSSGSPEVLATVASQYRNTKAGQTANELLGTFFLDRGDWFKAALQFERLIGPDPSKTSASDLMLLKATLAFKLAGDTPRAQEVNNVLEKRVTANGGLVLANGQKATAKQVKDFLKNTVRPALANIHDWPYVNGNLARNAQAKGSPPMLDYVLWMRPTLMDKSEESGEVQPGADAKPFLDKALSTHGGNDSIPVMPGGFPVAANGLLFYRTYDGITAVSIKDTVDKDGIETKAGGVMFRSTPFEGSLGVAMSEPGRRSAIQGWINDVYKQSGFLNLLYENSTVGTLSTDSRNVYAVDDLAVPIPPKYLMQQPVNFWNNSAFVHETIKPLVKGNTLWAFNIPSGKIEWKHPKEDSKESMQMFQETHFLCAPVSVGGKLYVLNEKNNGDLRLVCLDPKSGTVIGEPQELGTVRSEHRYFHDIARRVNAIHLAYGEGILVCPTNAGEILGVDLLSRQLAWAFPYRQKAPNPNAFPAQQFIQDPRGAIALSYSNWKVAPPVVADGKVVFTAPDASAIHCINLRDGSEVWSATQGDTDLFLAGVFGDKVVIVGKYSVRALRLADGAPLWSSLQTASLPSGQGVASNDLYYLPLSTGEIVAIDLDKWVIKAHNRSSDPKSPVPGNLVFYEGVVLSQTPTAVIAYPQLAAKLSEAEIAYTKTPSSENLLQRGELRLADGQTQKAVDDLQGVLEKEPADSKLTAKAKDRLYEALTDLLSVDFDNASKKYLKQYEQLCTAPVNAADKTKRETRYLRILAQGREAQGDLVQAFVAYKEFGASPLFKEEGIPSIEDPLSKVPVHLWLRGRIGAMFDKANAQQRVALEAKIAEEWAAVKTRDDVDAIRQFTGMFDVPFAVGREARLELANAVIAKKEKAAFLEAELNLQQLRVPQFRSDPAIGGKALEALARLEKVKGTLDSLQLAAAYYRELNRDFTKVVIAGSKTGADLFNNAVADDPRIGPFLEEQRLPWNNAAIKFRHFNEDSVRPLQGFVFQPKGDLTPLMQQHRLVLDPAKQNEPKLSLVDMSSGEVRWSTTLSAAPHNSQFIGYLYQQANNPMNAHADAPWRYFHVKGHLAVMQFGTMAYGVDLDNGKVLWSHVLYDPTKMTQANSNWQMTQDDQGRLWALHYTQFNQQIKARVGQVGTVQATYAALITPKGLEVLDPITGKALWTKAGLTSSTELFGDDQHIFYVETADVGPDAVGGGLCLRASDGANVNVPNFSFAYTHRQRIIGGRYILTAEPNGKALTIRYYDALTGKDKNGFKRTFDNGAVALATDEWYYCGAIERDSGKLTVVDLRDGKDVVTANLLQFRVSAEDMKELDHPLFLDDGQQFYVALNIRQQNNKILSNSVANNFQSGARCLPVNGWFVALDRKGEFLWHGHDRYQHQLIVVEQFKSLPVLLFSSRYMEMAAPGQGYQYFARTGSVNKATGKDIKWTDKRPTNGAVQYYAFNIDLKAGTISMVGTNTVDQWYVDQLPELKKGEGGGARQAEPRKAGGDRPQAIPIEPLPERELKLRRQQAMVDATVAKMEVQLVQVQMLRVMQRAVFDNAEIDRAVQHLARKAWFLRGMVAQ